MSEKKDDIPMSNYIIRELKPEELIEEVKVFNSIYKQKSVFVVKNWP